MIRIAIADDHQIVIDGLKLLLGNQPGFQIVAEATDGTAMLAMLQHTPVDVLMVDVVMPQMDGCALAQAARQLRPDISILALSMNNEGRYIDKMITLAGINGYILKTIGRKELIEAVETVAAGGRYFTDEVLSELHMFQKLKKENQQMNITGRELEIISCMARNLTNRQIADRLFISERTVETHRKNIFRKTDTHSVMSLLDLLRRKKIEIPGMH
jgi:two-component system nitrate/nitrite response regulator NarL